MNDEYKRLSVHAGFWRVDGVGPIDPCLQIGTRTTVLLSGLHEHGLEHPHRQSSRTGVHLRFRIHTASLRNFTVGSVWQAGKKIQTPSAPVKQIQIDTSQLRLFSLCEKFQLNNGTVIPSILPTNTFHLGENRSTLASTVFALAPTIGDRESKWFIVPCSELYRFYYGVSSELSSAILRGETGTYVNWSDSKFNKNVVELHLQKPLARIDRLVLARTLASPEARRAFFGIHQHLSKTHLQNKLRSPDDQLPLNLKAIFPFRGITKLSVLGRRAPLKYKYKGKDAEGKDQFMSSEWAFFGAEILRCTHPFGFEDLNVIERYGKMATEFKEKSDVGYSQIRHQASPDEDYDRHLWDDLPADARLRRLAVINYTNQFEAISDIKIKSIKKPTYSESNRGDLSSHGVNIPIQGDTLEDGNYRKDGEGRQGFNLENSEIDCIARDISLFLDVIKYLRIQTANRGWTITTRNILTHICKDQELITFFPLHIHRCRTWHLITECVDGKTRPRQIVCAEILSAKQNKHFYLLEIELKASEENGHCTLLLHDQDMKAIKNTDFNTLLNLTARHKRWPTPSVNWTDKSDALDALEFFKKYKLYRINHPTISKLKAFDNSRKPDEIWGELLIAKIDHLIKILLSA